VNDDRLDGRSPVHLAFDLRRYAPLLAGDEDPELIVGRRVVAAVAFIDEGTRHGVADKRLHVRNHGGQRVAVIRVARQRLDMGDELPAHGRFRFKFNRLGYFTDDCQALSARALTTKARVYPRARSLSLAQSEMLRGRPSLPVRSADRNSLAGATAIMHPRDQ